MSENPKADATESGPSAAAGDATPSAASADVVLVHGVSEDGKSLAVLRARNNTLEAGVVRALAEGEPIEGEVVRLKPRAECPVVCDVEVAVPRGALNARGGRDSAPAKRSGPAQVATASYRDNWDAIWQGRPQKPQRGGGLPN